MFLTCLFMPERPVCWTNAILIVVNAIVDEEIGIVSVEKNSNRFILLSRNEIEMVVF